MQKFDIKSIITGAVIGAAAVSCVYAASSIKSAAYSDAKVYFYNEQVPLKNQLVSIQKQGDNNAQLYMPVRELLEFMQFNVEYKNNSVYLTMNGYNGNNFQSTDTTFENDFDSKALEIMQKSGNWSYIEQYLPDMTEEGIKKVVEIYNSKHPNKSEHKKASDYFE